MKNDPVTFELSDAEKNSPMWARLKAHFEQRLHSCRLQNDRTQPEPQTAELRGQIKCLKAMIALGEDRPQTGDESDT